MAIWKSWHQHWHLVGTGIGISISIQIQIFLFTQYKLPIELKALYIFLSNTLFSIKSPLMKLQG